MLARETLKALPKLRSSIGRQNRALSFDLTEEQKNVSELGLKFAKQEILPMAKKHDETGEFPFELAKKAHENGLMNPHVPVEYGGPGLNNLDCALLNESLCYGCSGISLAINGAVLPGATIRLFANEEQKKKYLGWLAAEPIVASFCATEPGAGSDVSGVKTFAEKVGDEYVLNGTKCWITGGGHAKFFAVLARTDPNPKTSAGKAFTMFIVDGDAEGLSRGKKEMNMGQRASDTRSIIFDNVRVKKENVIGKEGEGFKYAMGTFDATRPVVASIGAGIMWRALDESVKYSLERKTFGTHIANHQGVQFMLADMATNLELVRMMTYRSAYLLDLKRSSASYYSSIGKLSAADFAQKAASDAVQIFGGNGFNCEYPVEKLMRDAKILQIYEGTSQIQRIVIARELLENYKSCGSTRLE